ncbi:MAG TPA: phosphonatase-like hydrolase [Pseudonocardia sp.]|uniref:phosphonatase-like hydrolase n=1 Tax=Pseudonocardia sp. TaxID=60912 RepID=UPI002C2C3105|nr:phosphonatase-like hydrolase [Pseudonocardia sp.]HTF53440.1 phosphonatase-like hydrolase [Pseudonocardia sp.]
MTAQQDIRLAVLDMAGTTVADDGLVETAFGAALAAAGVTEGSVREPELWQHVRDTMGQSKIEVFRAVFDEDTAQLANRAFEQSYNDQIDAGRAVPLPGAVEAIQALRSAGVLVTLTTGFSRDTQQRLVTALSWNGIADLILCPEDAGGRGRPYPDMVLTALLRLRVDDVAQIAVAGDTASDIRTGRSAGASIVAGVLTGAHDGATLHAAGATHVLTSIADLPALLLPAVAVTATARPTS